MRAEVIPKANDPGLRFFTVPKKIAVQSQSDTLPAAWEVWNSESARKFSAVAYFFARDLRRSLQVPLGVMLSAWPGSAAEEWTPLENAGGRQAIRRRPAGLFAGV
jgi:sialate O-acetylesterase